MMTEAKAIIANLKKARIADLKLGLKDCRQAELAAVRDAKNALARRDYNRAVVMVMEAAGHEAVMDEIENALFSENRTA